MNDTSLFPQRLKRYVAWLLRLINTSHTQYAYFNYASLIRYKYMLRRCIYFCSYRWFTKQVARWQYFCLARAEGLNLGFRFNNSDIPPSIGVAEVKPRTPSQQANYIWSYATNVYVFLEPRQMLSRLLKVMAEQTRSSFVDCKHKIFNEGLSLSQCSRYCTFYRSGGNIIDVTFTSHYQHLISLFPRDWEL